MSKKTQLVFEITIDGSLEREIVCMSSPSIPGLHVMGDTLASALRAAGPVAERLIELNKMRALRHLLVNVPTGDPSNG